MARPVTPRMTPYIIETPTPKQQVFLLLDCKEAMYGGAAGPGKSSALLMAALQYADTPGYAARGLPPFAAVLARTGAAAPSPSTIPSQPSAQTRASSVT